MKTLLIILQTILYAPFVTGATVAIYQASVQPPHIAYQWFWILVGAIANIVLLAYISKRIRA